MMNKKVAISGEDFEELMCNWNDCEEKNTKLETIFNPNK